MDFHSGVSRVHRHISRFAIPFVQRASSHSCAFSSSSTDLSKSSIKRQKHVYVHLCSQECVGGVFLKPVKRRAVAEHWFVSQLQWRTFTTSSSKAGLGNRDSGQEEKPVQHFPTDEGMNLRLSAENDYLSWMRNSYIMTLGGVSMLHFDLWSAGVIAGAAALITAGMNITVGSVGYWYNLQTLRRRGHISPIMCGLCQFWTLLHLLFWGTVLMVIFPDYKLIEVAEIDVEIQDKKDES